MTTLVNIPWRRVYRNVFNAYHFECLGTHSYRFQVREPRGIINVSSYFETLSCREPIIMSSSRGVSNVQRIFTRARARAHARKDGAQRDLRADVLDRA